MICPNCGSEIEPGAKFCGTCGYKVQDAQPAPEQVAYVPPVYERQAPEQPVYQQPAYEQPVYQQPVQQPYYNQASEVNPAEQSAAKSVLVMGIVALVFTCSFYLSIVGIILGAIGLGKAKNYLAVFGAYPPKVRVGKGLSLGALIGGIVLSVICFFVILAFIGAAITRY